ncbi:hypothetical protein [Spirosoma sp.]|uniref:hypothetical protein n=1 Tax=Spirosoma sp. TaxID=1899569 RepID=UPI003B3AE12C
MKSGDIFDAISGSYGKYFIGIRISGLEKYIVWGEDSTDNRDDKILLDQSNNVMVFESIPNGLHYILNPNAALFDSQNITDWAKACLSIQPSSNYTHDLDSIVAKIHSDQFNWLSACKREDCWEILNFIHLISDYAYQIDDAYLLDLYQSESVRLFSDYVYDNYFWTIPEEELATRNDQMAWESHYPQFKQNVIDLINTFRSRSVNYR